MLNMFVQRKLMRRFRAPAVTIFGTDYAKGSLGASETITRSAGGVFVFDHEGVLRFVRDNEAPFSKFRRVENVLARMGVTNSRDLTTAGWVPSTNCTITRDSTVLTDDGLPSNKVTFLANSVSASFQSGTVASTTAEKRSWVATVKLRSGTGATCIIGILAGGVYIALKTVALTSEWKIFSVQISNAAPASNTVAFTMLRDNSPWVGVNYIYVDWVMFEETTGASVNVFGGYVDVATPYGAGIAAVKNYDTTNGNTYNATSGAVTESAGAALTSGILFIEAQASNLVAATNYRDFSTWTLAGVTMKATTPTLIDGTTGPSAKNEILESATTTEHSASIAWTAATAAKQSAMIAVKRGTGTRHVQIRLYNATDLFYGSVTYNLDTLATIGTVTAEYTTSYVKGAYTIIELVDTNTTTGSQSLYVNIHDGTTNSYTGDGTSTLVLDWAQVVKSGLPQSHIQGGATRYASFLSRNWISATNNYWVYIDFDVRSNDDFVTAVVFNLFYIFKSTNDGALLRILDATGKLRLSSTKAAVNTTADSANMPFGRGNRIRAVFTQDQNNGMRVRVNLEGVLYTISSSTSNARAGAPELSSGATLYLGCFDNVFTDRVMPSEIRSYKVATGELTTQQLIDLVGI